MANTENLRKYRLKDSELIVSANFLIMFLEKDLSDLSDFGLTQDKINELKDINNQFKYFRTDPELKGAAIGSTEEKNAILEQVKEEIRKMTLRCRMKWGINSTEEKSLNISGFGNFSDENLLFASRRVHSQMTIFLPDLVEFGLTQEVLDNYENLNVSFENALNNQKDRVNSRLKSTEDRIKLGNELYKQVSMYSEMGKRCYAKSNPAKYNQYVIYPKSKKKEEQNESGENA